MSRVQNGGTEVLDRADVLLVVRKEQANGADAVMEAVAVILQAANHDTVVLPRWRQRVGELAGGLHTTPIAADDDVNAAGGPRRRP